jgi:curved DNA-binding protein
MTTDYYSILGVSESATPDEIKKAYRKLANQHHPDKGGDQAKFKDISVAYDTLGDANKRAEYDNQRRFGGGQGGPGAQHFHFNTGGFDPFGHMFGAGFGGHPFEQMFRGGGQRVQRNRDLNIQCQISFIDSFTGKQLEANFKLPSGKNQNVVINVPPGVNHGETIRYNSLGDDTISNIPRGNLNVTILVEPDPKYQRIGDDVYTTVEINPIEAIIGCKKRIRTLAGTELNLEIRAGVEDGVEFASNGNGFPNVNTGRRGRLVSIVKVKTPNVTDPNIIKQLSEINEKISKQ